LQALAYHLTAAGRLPLLAVKKAVTANSHEGVVGIRQWFDICARDARQIFFTLGFIEVTTNAAGLTPGTMFQSGRAPGDLGFDPLNLSVDDSALRRFELAELKHGRLAMIGLGGMLHQMLLTKQAPLAQLANFKSLEIPTV
jgi:hypothetical protein